MGAIFKQEPGFYNTIDVLLTECHQGLPTGQRNRRSRRSMFQILVSFDLHVLSIGMTSNNDQQEHSSASICKVLVSTSSGGGCCKGAEGKLE